MPLVELVDGRIEIETDPYRDRILVREVPGRKWDDKKRTWWAPLSWATCVALRGVFEDDLVIGERLAAWALLERQRRVNPSMLLRTQLALDAPPDWFETWAEGLYPFQLVGAAFLTVAHWALLADEMRLGKTVQTIAALRARDTRRALVVSPNSVKRVWARELEKWWPEVEVHVYRPGAAGKKALEAVRDFGGVLVVNWENTYRLSRLAPFGSIKLTDKDREPKALNWIEWDAIVVDEAHRMKEPNAKQTRATWAVMHQVEGLRVALTGTPVANSPRDLWSIMHGLVPEEYPGYTQFVDRYGLMSWNAFGGLEVVGLNPKTRDEFFRFFDPRFLRRTRELVRPDLPPKVFTERYVTLPAKQKKAYKELEKQMLTELDNGDVAYVTRPLTKLIRLRQLAAAYVNVTDGKWTLTEPSGKLDELEAVLEEAGDEQVVVFAEHRQLIELAAARLAKKDVSFGLITGGVDEEDRARTVDLFQAGKLQVVLATLGAGGEGITLSAAKILVFLQRSFSAIKDSQAQDRGIDLSSPDLEIIDLIVEDTVEERIFDVLAQKSQRLEEICRDQENLRLLLGGK